jgi:hypothetical protein
VLEPLALPGDRHDVGMMQQPVEQRRGQRGILREGAVLLSEDRLLVTIRLPRSWRAAMTWKNRLACSRLIGK